VYISSFKPFVLLFLCLYGTIALGQDNSKIISGYVFNENLVALSNALIYNEQFSIGTTSDCLGRFTLQLPKASALLRFSHVSYTAQYKNISDANAIKIQLIPKKIKLESVEIESNDIVKVHQKINTNILDFEFYDENIVLLLIENGTHYIRAIDASDNTLAELQVSPQTIDLYVDYYLQII